MAGCPATWAVLRQNLALLRTRVFLIPFAVGVLAAIYATILHMSDQRWGYHFVRDWAPKDLVFNVFITFCSFISAFRTAHALSRYTDAASSSHKLSACWFDAASTLVAFCRTSQAPAEDVDNFTQTMARLISLLNALCFDELQHRDPTARGGCHRFQILGTDDLDEETQKQILGATYKVECVFQMIQQAVVDAIDSKVLSIAPPILSRSFQELGAGLLTFHEAKKIAQAPLPHAYHLFTNIVLAGVVLCVPWMLALYTSGEISTFCLTLMGVFLIWFLNSVADALDNPFQRLSNTLEAPMIQQELNGHLEQLLEGARAPTPRTIPNVESIGKRGSSELKRQSMFQWASRATDDLSLQESSSEEGNPGSTASLAEERRVPDGADSALRVCSEVSHQVTDSAGSCNACPEDPPDTPVAELPMFAARLVAPGVGGSQGVTNVASCKVGRDGSSKRARFVPCTADAPGGNAEWNSQEWVAEGCAAKGQSVDRQPQARTVVHQDGALPVAGV